LSRAPARSSTSARAAAKGGFLSFGPLQAGKLFIFEPLDFALGEPDLVLEGLCLGGRGHSVALGLETGSFLLVAGYFLFEAAPQRFFAVKRIVCGSSIFLRGFHGGVGLRDFGRQGTQRLGEAGALQVHVLQLYEVFNLSLHPWNEV
jgi:hypothetical protein